jgi:hypothetical protein
MELVVKDLTLFQSIADRENVPHLFFWIFLRMVRNVTVETNGLPILCVVSRTHVVTVFSRPDFRKKSSTASQKLLERKSYPGKDKRLLEASRFSWPH